MSNRNFTYLILTTVTLFALAFISYLIQPRYETFIKKGELIFKETQKQLNNIKEINIDNSKKKITILKNEDNNWYMSSKSSYKAKNETVRKNLIQITELRFFEKKTEQESLYSRLDLDYPKNDDGDSKLITIFDDSSEKDHPGAYKVKTFAEKPHHKLAQRFIASGDFLWNAGMFIWKIDTLMTGLRKNMPDLYESLQNISLRLKDGKLFDDIWEYIDPVSIDYGLLEKSKNIYVVACEFQWNDLGSWNALYDVLGKDNEGNIVRGKGKIMGGHNNFIESNGRFTAVIGVDDLVVINTEDATLVVPREKVEIVKEMVDFLKKQGRKDLI